MSVIRHAGCLLLSAVVACSLTSLDGLAGGFRETEAGPPPASDAADASSTDASLDASVGPSDAGGCTSVTAGPMSPLNVVADPGLWSGAFSVEVADGKFAEAALYTGATVSPIAVNQFGFTVPVKATITGVTVLVTRRSLVGVVGDKVVALTPMGSRSLAKPGGWPTSFQTATYGGPNELWGLSLTPAQVNDPTFGASLLPVFLDSAGNDRAQVDAIQITVTYCD